MPIGTECIKLLRNLVDNYTQRGKEDKDFNEICPLLKEFLFTVSTNKDQLKDDRVISFLSSSSVVLENSPAFSKLCRAFLMSYQELTFSLDSMLDTDLRIQTELDESWGTKSKVGASPTHYFSPFFIELNNAIAKRNQRLEEHKENKTM